MRMHHPPTPSLKNSKGGGENASSAGIASEGRRAVRRTVRHCQSFVLALEASDMNTEIRTGRTVVWASSCKPTRAKSGRVTGQETLEQAGYHVITAIDRASILHALDSSSPDVLIADFEMLCAGEEPLLLQIARSISHRHLPVLTIMLGEELFPDWMWEVDQTVCFLRTPFQAGELAEFVRRITKAHEHPDRPL